MLTLQNVTKKFGSELIIDDFNLEFEKGVNVLLAPNGAGKTTLMKMAATLMAPTAGKILYSGKEINQLGVHYRNVLGYLPQKAGYYKNYTAEEFLFYLGVLKNVDKKRIRKRIDHLLELVELSEVRSKKAGIFSGGMIQRLLIAGVLINDPEVIILDEPTTGLDPKERIRFKNIISHISRDRIVVISTHITSEVEFIANKIIMMKDHKILYKDSVSNITSNVKGKIYETFIKFDQLKMFEKENLVISERQENEDVVIRFYCDGEPPSMSVSVSPVLEDVFVSTYQ